MAMQNDMETRMLAVLSRYSEVLKTELEETDDERRRVSINLELRDVHAIVDYLLDPRRR